VHMCAGGMTVLKDVRLQDVTVISGLADSSVPP